MIQYNQIGCYSCGAGLLKTDGLCKCQYCGNINLIQNGKTQIVWIEYNKQIQKQKLSKSTQVLILGGLLLFPMLLIRRRFSLLFGDNLPQNTKHKFTTKVRLANGAIIEV